MTSRTATNAENVIWRGSLNNERDSLANAVRETLASHREYLLDFIRLDEPAPYGMTLAEWSQGSALQTLMATYSDHIYRNQLTQPRENKPLLAVGTVVSRADGTAVATGAVDAEKRNRHCTGTFPRRVPRNRPRASGLMFSPIAY